MLLLGAIPLAGPTHHSGMSRLQTQVIFMGLEEPDHSSSYGGAERGECALLHLFIISCMH